MTPPDLAEQVAAHMTAHFPTTEFGGWEVARDPDHAAVIAWRRHGSTLTTPAVRGQLLARWLDHLRGAGFDGTARTDRSVFDGSQQPDGYVCWLHITGRRETPAGGGPVASGNHLTRE
ncbi:hypothetical protein JL475_00205 [Streptomyces sp. M2CJ-2]|uniref:hypothetical protein n=1 Tax=Streptomyces sp. M2CJ-2 TaxID=2803948 RepID=UPI00192119C5|nr:hypothetical protein [Streptomyces sp. M2CJ-2]MBL3664467.1 hypothetical protein [Streptomyces sp. M2CJ-2]